MSKHVAEMSFGEDFEGQGVNFPRKMRLRSAFEMNYGLSTFNIRPHSGYSYLLD